MPNDTSRLLGCTVLTAALAFSTSSDNARAETPKPGYEAAAPQIESYTELVYRNYRDAYAAARGLQDAVDRLVAAPDEATLEAARDAWLAARPSYGQTEAFRFYGGPIDAGKQDDLGFAPPGVEGLLNAWPLNEAYIDYVQGDPRAGLVGDERFPITRETLVRRNARDDEADVTTGYHAIEFLLWGQDLDADGPGHRSAADFVGDGTPARRRAYLKATVDLLVENLGTLVDAWSPGKQNYRALMLRMSPDVSLRNILTGISTLSGFEMASERLATALDSGSQEDEQSCFSDNTHVDLLANATGIENVYFGRYGDWQGTGLNELVAAANPDLDRYLEKQIRETVTLAGELDRPFDRILASPPGSPARVRAEALVKALQTQADLLKHAASALGVPIVIGDAD
jgi:putative iron-regulated protein